MAHRLEITLRDDMLAALDGARGHEARASFVKRALEALLTDETPRPSPAGREAKTEAVTSPARPVAASPQSASRPSASPRASAAATILRCPVKGCEFTATSPAATCGKHGRKVKAR